MYELVYWRFGTVMTDSYESKDDAIARWVAGLDHNEFFSPGFVDRDQRIAFFPDSRHPDHIESSSLALLKEGLGISLADFQVEFFKIPEP